MAGSTQRRPARARRNGAASLKSRPELSSGRLAIRGAQPGRDEGHPVTTRGEPGEATPPTRAAALPLPPPPPSRASSPHTTALEGGRVRALPAGGGGHLEPGPAARPPAAGGLHAPQGRVGQSRAGPGLSHSLPRPRSARTRPPIHPSIPRAGPPATGGSGRTAVQEQAHLSPRRPPAGQEEGGDRRTRLRDERGQRLPDSTRRLTSCVPHSCCPAPDIIPPPLPAPCRDALPLLRPEAPLAPPWRFPTYLLHPPTAASPVTRRTKEAGAAPGWKRRGRAWAGGAGRPASAGARGRRAAKSHGVSRQRAS